MCVIWHTHTHTHTHIYTFFWPHSQHVEVSVPGRELMPQQWPKLLQWQFQILNPLCHKRTTPRFPGQGSKRNYSYSYLGSRPSATYSTAHGNAGSLTHWARPGIEAAEIIHLWTMSHGGHYCAWVRCGLQLQMGMLSHSTLSQKRTPAKSDGECGFFETTSHCNYPRAYPLKRSFGKMIYIAKNPFVKWIQVCSPLSKSNLQIQFNSTNVYWLLFLYAGHHASASDKKDI